MWVEVQLKLGILSPTLHMWVDVHLVLGAFNTMMCMCIGGALALKKTYTAKKYSMLSL